MSMATATTINTTIISQLDGMSQILKTTDPADIERAQRAYWRLKNPQDPEHQNATRLVQALFRFGYTDGEFEPDDFMRVPNFLSFSRYDHWIDIMTFSLGITFDACFTNRKVIELDGVAINFINLPELIKTKQAVGRPKDLLDISELLDIRTNEPTD
jgi:hypothetical protein